LTKRSRERAYNIHMEKCLQSMPNRCNKHSLIKDRPNRHVAPHRINLEPSLAPTGLQTPSLSFSYPHLALQINTVQSIASRSALLRLFAILCSLFPLPLPLLSVNRPLPIDARLDPANIPPRHPLRQPAKKSGGDTSKVERSNSTRHAADLACPLPAKALWEMLGTVYEPLSP
jgi:hypothetical protein